MPHRLVRAAVLAALVVAVLVPLTVRAQETDLTQAPRIMLPEFKKLRAQGQVVVIDVRDPESFKSGHIPGALSIPMDRLAGRVDELKAANKPIVTYCA
jgi:3-mercaptopyruvate sulfurtransferase SseA